MVYTVFPFSYDYNQQAWEIVFIPHNYMFRLKHTLCSYRRRKDLKRENWQMMTVLYVGFTQALLSTLHLSLMKKTHRCVK